ncbi:conserved hypothetical protein [Ricinus communis]|uniref:Uncharacterized protein n=1 Tax=Ricinus communis TaxID=3988 RepID=B9STW5_RICCO|nr:conserved hypothetical protein [Ricinus communis]
MDIIDYSNIKSLCIKTDRGFRLERLEKRLKIPSCGGGGGEKAGDAAEEIYFRKQWWVGWCHEEESLKCFI